MQEKLDDLKNSSEPQPIRSDGAGALDLGPRNPVVKYPGFEMPPANRTPQNVRYFKNFDYKVKDTPCKAAKEH